MARDTLDKSGSIDELRDTTRTLAAWRAGALVRINRKQTERAVRRAVRRASGEHSAVAPTPSSKR